MSPMESMDWNAPLPKPVSKSEMSKASNLDGDISTDDLRRYNWQAVIAEHPDKQSLSYFEPLRLEAERLRAAGDLRGFRAVAFMFSSTHRRAPRRGELTFAFWISP
jgi:hypothetical protein